MNGAPAVHEEVGQFVQGAKSFWERSWPRVPSIHQHMPSIEGCCINKPSCQADNHPESCKTCSPHIRCEHHCATKLSKHSNFQSFKHSKLSNRGSAENRNRNSFGGVESKALEYYSVKLSEHKRQTFFHISWHKIKLPLEILLE